MRVHGETLAQLAVAEHLHGDRAAGGQAGLAKRRDTPVKILGSGDLSKALTVHAHGFSATAREKIEGAGGSVQVIEE